MRDATKLDSHSSADEPLSSQPTAYRRDARIAIYKIPITPSRPFSHTHAKPPTLSVRKRCGNLKWTHYPFLGVPLIDRGVLQGVLVVQTIDSRVFLDDEIRMLMDAAAQVAPVVSEARTLDRFVAPAQERLWALARNLWWSWDHDCVGLFRDLDPVRFRQLNNNPISLLTEMPLEEIERRSAELMLHSRINYAYRRQQEYLQADRTWGASNAGVLRPRPVAYFSAEFGLHESIPIYSGGLGVLAGDHIKSASDLNIPLIGIGLFYGQGYFRQRLDMSGWQQEDYQFTDISQVPMEPAIGKNGMPVTIRIDTRSGWISAKVWRIKVGRCDLLLLDSNVDGNAPEDRELTSRLYGGDGRVRIRQELLLGVGGVRALREMGVTPGVYHMNEGHSGFAVLEAIRTRMADEGISFDQAVPTVAREVVFTTHTPVPAGHDRFHADLIEEHLGPLRESLGISHERLMSLGRENPSNPHELFCMTVVGLKLSRRANAVSSLHGEVSRAMWTGLYPGRIEDAVPIGHITNGVHVPSWLAPQMSRLYDRHLGAGWQMRNGKSETWEGIDSVDDAELWETHLTLKSRLLDFVRRRAVEQFERRREPAGDDSEPGPPVQSRRADDRICAAVRNLQAGQPDPGGYRTPGHHGERSETPGAVCVRGQGASPRRAGQAGPAADCGVDARPAVFREVRLRGRLRHQRRALPRAGRRCLAEQSAPAARSFRHQRPEGGSERRIESVRARRLVGGGL